MAGVSLKEITDKFWGQWTVNNACHIDNIITTQLSMKYLTGTMVVIYVLFLPWLMLILQYPMQLLS